MEQLFPPLLAAGAAGELGGEQVASGDLPPWLRGHFLPHHRSSCPQQRLLQHLRTHPFHPQLTLLAGCRLPALLAVDVRNVGVLHLILGQDAFQMVADDKACAVAVGEDNESLGGGQLTQHLHRVLLLKNLKAIHRNDEGVHHLGQGVLVVPPLHHDGLFDLQHPFRLLILPPA